MQKIENITIIGDGSWGTTLAIYLYNKNYEVNLWGVFPDYLKILDNERENPKFLPGIKIPPKINITSDIDYVIDKADLVIFAVPSKFMRSVVGKFSHKDFIDKSILSVAKGIEEDTFMRMTEVIKEELRGMKNISVLSGPTIAYEVIENMPAASVIASEDEQAGPLLQEVLNSASFRIYTNPDVIGIELCGAIKNVMAIAAGISDGIGFGTNTKAALLTRATVEIIRLGKELGAKMDTFNGLAGIGDLITTCFSYRSRNRGFGEEIGKGRTKDEIVGSMEMVVEGITTVKGIYGLGKKLHIDLPITNQVYEVLYNHKPPEEAVIELMTRVPKSEYI